MHLVRPSILRKMGIVPTTGAGTQHPEWSTHPIDGKPFRWSPATGELAVNTVGTHPYGRRFSVIVRQGPATNQTK
jgi:hypothetical protein